MRCIAHFFIQMAPIVLAALTALIALVLMALVLMVLTALMALNLIEKNPASNYPSHTS